MVNFNKVCVYCGSSAKCNPIYLEAANLLGKKLAENNIDITFGGGSVGLMGKLADGALSKGGNVIGIIPEFMNELEWAHKGLTELRIVKTMHERKHMLIEGVDAVIALPGGCGTFEEVFEAITLKRLGIYLNPIVFVNIKGYFDFCLKLLDHCIDEHFMREVHRNMWVSIDRVEDVIQAIKKAYKWKANARHFAVV